MLPKPSFPLTWGIFPLCMYRQYSFLFLFLFAYLKHFHVLHFSASREPQNGNTEGTIQKILKNGNRSWKENSYSPAPQMGCWHWFHWTCFLWPLQTLTYYRYAGDWGGGCKLARLDAFGVPFFFLSFFMDMGKNIGELCPPCSKGQERRWDETSVALGVLPWVTTILSA